MESDGGGGGREAATLWQAMQIILMDVTMSLDNVLAVVGAAEGNLFCWSSGYA